MAGESDAERAEAAARRAEQAARNAREAAEKAAREAANKNLETRDAGRGDDGENPGKVTP